jgi:hypothetical protein
MKKTSKIITIANAALVISFLAICLYVFSTHYALSFGGYFQTVSTAANALLDNVGGRTQYAERLNRNLYGLGLKALRQKNFNLFDESALHKYMLDKNDSIQVGGELTNLDDVESFLFELGDYFEPKNVPVVYVSPPASTAIPKTNAVSVMSKAAKTSQIQEKIQPWKEHGVSIFDANSEFHNPSFPTISATPEADYWKFKTDIHPRTESELWLAEILCRYLKSEYGINFPKVDTVFDTNNYELDYKDWYGGNIRGFGSYVVPHEKFLLMHPNFTTDFTMKIPETNQVKNGDFTTAVTKDFETTLPLVNDETFWVNNYGNDFTNMWEIHNNDIENAPNLLIFASSDFYRGESFLALTSENVVVFYHGLSAGQASLSQIVQDYDFDAVLVLPGPHETIVNLPELPEIESPQTDILVSSVNGYDLYNPAENGIPVVENTDRIIITGEYPKDINSLWIRVNGKTDICLPDQNDSSIFTINFPRAWVDGANQIEFLKIYDDSIEVDAFRLLK